MGESPYIIIKKREGLGTFKKSIRIARVWQNNQTGNIVEVRAVQNVVPDNYLRIVFWDPTIKHELSMPLKPRPNPFQPPGAPEILMEPGFDSEYHVYENQRTDRI